MEVFLRLGDAEQTVKRVAEPMSIVTTKTEGPHSRVVLLKAGRGGFSLRELLAGIHDFSHIAAGLFSPFCCF